MSEANQSWTSRVRLTNSTGINTIQLPALPEFVIPSGATKISEVLEIINFKARVSITSIAASPLPNYSLEDTETDRLMKSLDLEWKSPRKQLNLLAGTGNFYSLIGSVSLLNTSGYPYRIYNLKQIYSDADNAFIGNNVNLAFQLEDVGYGLLAGGDKVDIWCDYVRTISYFVSEIITINPATTIAPPNITIQNLISGNISPSPNPTPIPTPEQEEDMPFKIISQNYQAVDKDRLFISYGEGIDYIIITLPSNPVEGTQIEIAYFKDCLCFVDLNGKKFEYRNNIVALAIDPLNGFYAPQLLIYGKKKNNELTWVQSTGSYDMEFNALSASEYEERKQNPFG